MASETCHRCRFWLLDETTHTLNRPIEDGDIAFGACRRNAPVVVGALAPLVVNMPAWTRDRDVKDDDLTCTEISWASVQPVTESAAWCGRYESKPSSLLAMLAERNALITHIDDDKIGEDEAEAGCGQLKALDGKIIGTPSVTKDDVIAKLLLAVQLVTEGHEVVEDDAASIVREAQVLIGEGRVSPNVAAMREG